MAANNNVQQQVAPLLPEDIANSMTQVPKAAIDSMKVMTPNLDVPIKNPNIAAPQQVVTNVPTNAKPISLDINVLSDDGSLKKQCRKFVRLPHSGYEFDVRGLIVEEEDAIKSSFTSGKRYSEMLTKVLWECISDDVKTKDHPFGRFDTFCRSISLDDRNTIALAVIEQTYESTHNMRISCPHCNKVFDEMVCLPNCMKYEYYRGSVPIMERRQEIDIPDIHWKLYLKIPTVADELKMFALNQDSAELQNASNYLFIDKLEYDDVNDKGVKFHDVINNYIQIYGMLRKQPAILRKRLQKEYEDFRGEYGVKGSYDTECKFCKNPITMYINPMIHFLSLIQ